MGRDTKAKCKKCRREGSKLFLKGEKCYSDKCPLTRKSYPPGEAGESRSRWSQYRIRLREKQKARRIYGLREEQFRKYFEQSKSGKEVTGEALLRKLEKRLDNVLYRSGLAQSRDQARQLINHGHIEVNGRSVDIPSYMTEEGDVVAFKENSRSKEGLRSLMNEDSVRIPPWIDLEPDNMRASVLSEPAIDDVEESLQVNRIVEFYSR
ncbi:30S ribosomal protein S4 [Candidatus Bipolaricaulota bacterium]|nr:30S ribosomal protein S4 [Candidatus Bipolaricaulota bacterium]MBS3813831.1 30S ribosomal protein S4 [Candidatus Bipolaricaulota bacterium]MBS3824950.1 30S ribosomal protein S4 [Candidatus Bipolaricaulota bacterium]